MSEDRDVIATRERDPSIQPLRWRLADNGVPRSYLLYIPKVLTHLNHAALATVARMI